MSGFTNKVNFSQREFQIPSNDKEVGSPTCSYSESQTSSNEASQNQVMQNGSSRNNSVSSNPSRRAFGLSRMLPTRFKKSSEPKADDIKVEKVQKKRGPKPDSKPAQNRRQELNRAAQRTHRERKERHLKDVERQVRILEANSAQAAGEMERLRNSMEALRDENRVLRQLLDENHILREQLEAENTPITPAAFLNAQQQQSSAMGNMSTRTNSPLTNGYLAQSHNAPGYGGAITTYHNNGVSNGQSDNAAVGYEQTNNTVNGYDQTNGGAVNYHQVDNNTVNYHQADNTAIHYGQANNTPPNYHQPDNTPFGYVQPNNSPVNYHQANNGTPGYGQNTHAAINYGQFDNTTAGHDQTDDTVATYNQLNNTAAGYGQYDNTAVNYGQTSNAAVMSQAPPMQGSTSAGQIQIFNDRSITGSARFDVNPYTVIYPPYDYANGFQWRPGMLHPALNGPNDRTFINFIVDLEETCNDHTGLMLQRLENDATDDFSGHTLMLSTHGLVDRSTETLNLRLLNAPTVNVNGEITPIVAAKMIMDDPRYQYLTPAEFQAIQANLKAKSRCYGFGAVLEDYEILDAMEEASANHAIPANLTW